jgi:hypothetical protein
MITVSTHFGSERAMDCCSGVPLGRRGQGEGEGSGRDGRSIVYGFNMTASLNLRARRGPCAAAVGCVGPRLPHWRAVCEAIRLVADGLVDTPVPTVQDCVIACCRSATREIHEVLMNPRVDEVTAQRSAGHNIIDFQMKEL